MSDRDNERMKPNRLGRFSRTASFWILIILIPLLILNVVSPSRQDAAELSYTDFDRQLRDGNIATVTVVAGSKVEGELKQPIVQDGKQTREFWAQLPIANDPRILEDLKANNVPEIRGAEPRQNWWTLIISVLPWLLIFGFWIFMLRQMQVGGTVE